MKSKSLFYALTTAVALGLSHAALADNSTTTASTPPPTSSGDAAQSKSGTGPGGTGSTAPDASPAVTSTEAASSTSAPQGPTSNSGDAAQSKSGTGPGGNANPPGASASSNQH